jgi:DNA primase
MTVQQAKSIPFVDFLANLGFSPTQIKKNGADYWYKSPLRPDENTASFHVHKTKNTWFDFGIGKGGSIIDFVVLLKNCEVATALDFIENNFISLKTQKQIAKTASETPPSVNSDFFSLDEIRSEFAASLLKYLQERCINIQLISQVAVQVHFSNREKKQFFAIGMKNTEGGYEVRNRRFKGCIGKKSLTFLKGKTNDTIVIFEGMFDFFAALTHFGQTFLDNDVLILNSASLQEQAIQFLKDRPHYKKLSLFLDNDAAGQTVFERLQTEFPNQILEPSFALYLRFKDFNDYLIVRYKNGLK